MKVERLVVDTNVWIAALISPDGTARELVRAVLDRDIDVLFTESTFNELVSRLAKPKFDRYLLTLDAYESIPVLTPAQWLTRLPA
jgi:putative PIN family toxin of toxin-antitoxin system